MNETKSCLFNDRLRISITDACNYKCFYCSNEGQSHGNCNMLSLDFVRQMFSKIREENIFVKKLNITGGEPTLHPQLLEILREGTKITENVTLNTNGSLLNKERIDAIKATGINCIKFGTDLWFSDKSKPITNAYQIDMEKLVDCILYSRKVMPRSSMNIVITDFNYPYFDRMLDWIEENDIDKVEFIELINFDFENKESVKPLSRVAPDFPALIKRNMGQFERIEYNPAIAKYVAYLRNGLAVQFAEDFCKRKVCANLWTRIDADGNFSPCMKNTDVYPIDMKKPLYDQFLAQRQISCGAFKDIFPRDMNGRMVDGWTIKSDDEIVPSIIADTDL